MDSKLLLTKCFEHKQIAKYLLLALFWTVHSVALAQGPAWQSVVATAQTGGPNFSSVSATASDANGNIYITGNFSGDVTFGAIRLTSASLGPHDVFVAKWNSVANAFVWAVRAGGPGYDQVSAIAVQGTSIYITGISSFSAGAVFGNATLTGGGSMFLAKLTDSGLSASFVWAQASGATGGTGGGLTAGDELAVSGTNLYVAGGFSGPTTSFGSITLSNSDVSGNSSDSFVEKLVDNGNSGTIAWVQRAGGVGNDNISAIALNGTSIYIAGSFVGSTAVFGSNTLTNSSPTYADAFIAKLTDTSTSGDFVWAQRAGGTGSDAVSAMVANGANLYVVGAFTSNSATFGAISLANAGSQDLFVAKLVDAGNAGSFVWAQPAGGTGDDRATGLAISGTSLYIAGVFSSATLRFGNAVLTNAGDNDVFIAKCLDSGTSSSFGWAQRGGGAGPETASSVVVSGSTVAIAGQLQPPSTFGSLVLSGVVGSNAAFVASLDSNGPLATTTAVFAGLTLTPNPTRAAATVYLPAVAGVAQATLTLVDALGRKVCAKQVALSTVGATTEISSATLAPGVYHLHVQAGSAQANRTLVVE